MALNIPMPRSGAQAFSSAFDSGAAIGNRLMQDMLQKAQMQQAQKQFEQNYALSKAREARANALQPYLMQQYQDQHISAAADAAMKNLYRSLIQPALNGSSDSGMPNNPNVANNSPNVAPVEGEVSDAGTLPAYLRASPSPDQNMAAPSPVESSVSHSPMPTLMQGGEQVLRQGNPALSKVDSVAGLVPGIPKPQTHYANGIIYTTYPSGRMTAQAINLPNAKTAAEKNTAAKAAVKIREEAASLIKSANLVQQGYDIMDANPNLTGPATGLANRFNLLNNPALGEFNSVTGKLQAELGRLASSRGGIQAVKWAQTVKPSTYNPEKTNYGMFKGLRDNILNDYKTLNEQYKAETGQDLPIKLPEMTTKRGNISDKSSKVPDKKVTDWQMVNGKLVLVKE